MYELLIKWAVGTIKEFSGKEYQHAKDIAIEAIKTKNHMVTERFNVASEVCLSIHSMTVDLYREIDEFCSDIETSNDRENAWRYLGKIKTDFHPRYYRQLSKMINVFEISNELLAAYSKTFQDIVHIENIIKLAAEKSLYSGADIRRLYRGLWELYSSIVSRTLRVSSIDLRFWIAEKPYIETAYMFSKKDLDQTFDFLKAKQWGGRYYTISLESAEGLSSFWKEVQAEWQQKV